MEVFYDFTPKIPTEDDILKLSGVEQAYVAVLLGHPNPPFGKIDKPLVKAVIRGRETVMISGASDSYSSDYDDNKNSNKPLSKSLTKPQSAITEYKTIFTGNDPRGIPLSVVALFPSTGRKHQLRVHCASMLGCPILGDLKYTKKGKEIKMKNLKMHLHMTKINLPLVNPDGTVRTENNIQLKAIISDPFPSFWKKTLSLINYSNYSTKKY
ncbi:RNA pseudouridine synthase 4, mitochondrial [Smittium culicis]|uniref:RNA pseudouridine synthase 4, mitochondrial n=1 Tax=Smittium culicis TaxID=133412 RepID=A0A1R1YFC7_9FUNG|nr:RNA pseudouridine synthase 4, mitochondrial [Smittium culicis]